MSYNDEDQDAQNSAADDDKPVGPVQPLPVSNDDDKPVGPVQPLAPARPAPTPQTVPMASSHAATPVPFGTLAVSHPQSFAQQTGYRPAVKLPVTPEPGPITRTLQSLSQQAETTPDMPLGRRIAGGITRGVVNTLGFIPETVEAIAQGDNPGDAVRAVYDRTVAPQVNEYRIAKRESEQGNTSQSMGHSIAAAVPFAGPLAANISERAGTGDVAGATAEGLTYALAPKAIETMKGAPFEAPSTQELRSMPSTALDASRTALATATRTGSRVVNAGGRLVSQVTGTGRYADVMDRTIPGTDFTRRDVYDAARNNGVNLDLQQATGAAVPTAIKRATEDSMFSGGVYERNNQANVEAVNNWLSRFRTQMGFSEGEASREQVGNQAKAALIQHQQGLQNQAQGLFNELTQEVGNSQPDTSDINSLAKQIIKQNSDYYDNHPELLPQRAWNIVENLANGPKDAQFKPHGRMPAVDTSAWDGSAPKEAKPDTWSDLQKLRSDLMNEYRSNPAIVGTQAEGWMKQLVGAIDNTMTDSARTLTPQQAAKFRTANSIWEQMKQTYDNPTSPLYSAIRGTSGTQVASILSRLDPQYLRTIAGASPRTAQAIRQIVFESILDPKGTGVPDPRNITSRMKNVERLGAMFTPDELREMGLLGRVSDTVNQDLNRSGSGRNAVALGSVAAPISAISTGVATLNPPVIAGGVAMPLLQRVAAKRSVNPAVVERAIRRGSRSPSVVRHK